MLLTAYTLPSLWFHRKRALVSGISLAGSGACYILYSPLIDSLIEQYTARGALLILGAVNLHNLALAALIWTWKSPKTQAMASKGKLGPSRDLDADARDLKIIRSPKKSCSLLKKIWNLSRSIFSGHLFRSPHFYQIIFSAMCYCLVGFSMPQIFKDYSRTLEIPKAMSSMLLSIMGVSIVILKISVGVFANYIRRPLIIYLAGGCVLAAVTSLLPIVPALYYAYTTLYSCGSSLYLSMQTSVIATILGPENITSTMGYIFFVQGITLLTVVPAFLQLNVLTGTYTMTLLLLGMITAVGVVVMVPFLCQRHFR